MSGPICQLKLPVDITCGRMRARTSFSKIFDTVGRFVMGLKFAMSAWSSPGFFNSRLTRPHFNADGKTPVLNDKSASRAIGGAMASTVDFNSEVGMKSALDVLPGNEPIKRATSPTVTPDRTHSLSGWCLHVGSR